ncbi:MAG: hypothetical protein JNL67_03885 [Planctomycetaceae bacterium]|nr:hypothetical protein [Planctomycetaceae bacterium]
MKRFHSTVILLGFVLIVGLAAVFYWFGGARRGTLRVASTYGLANDNESIHGFGALAQLLRQRGHQVARTKMLTRQIDRYDLLIWTHLGPNLPDDAALDLLDAWMDGGNTVVFVGCDYDASQAYWRSVYQESQGPNREIARWAYRNEQLKSLRERELTPFDELLSKTRNRGYRGNAANQWLIAAGDGQPKTGYWQPVDPNGPWQQVGPPPAKTFDLGSTGPAPVTVRNWLKPKSNDARVLATIEHRGEQIPTLWRETWSSRAGREGRDLWVISHPIFLCNFGIFQPENAKLRDHFLEEITYQKRVLFLETGPQPVLLSSVPDDRIDQSWAWMTKGPFPIFVLHAVILAVVFCFARFPVFGRARRIEFEPRNDFGQHVAEVGRMLRLRQLESFARQKLEHYYQVVRRHGRQNSS